MGAMVGIRQYQDGWWTSPDGLRLHYRDYPGNREQLPILCLHGLTRNARDFHHVAQWLEPNRRVISVDIRGRGESAYASDPASYSPLTYLGDLEALLAELKIKKFVAFGTSMGGIMTMLLAASKPGRIAAALLNDIGPDIEASGLGRIMSYVGKSQNWPTWIHAARGIAEIHRHAYPAYDLESWLAFAKRTCRLSPQGRVVLDYDMKIAEPLRQPQAAVDLWPSYQALGDVPVTIVRGELTDVLSEATAKRMAKELPAAKLVTVKGVGHAPMLDEPEAVRAIDALLKAVGK
jgi:pimeloyl-ACP methyl ester carboxylesterase